MEVSGLHWHRLLSNLCTSTFQLLLSNVNIRFLVGFCRGWNLDSSDVLLLPQNVRSLVFTIQIQCFFTSLLIGFFIGNFQFLPWTKLSSFKLFTKSNDLYHYWYTSLYCKPLMNNLMSILLFNYSHKLFEVALGIFFPLVLFHILFFQSLLSIFIFNSSWFFIMLIFLSCFLFTLKATTIAH